MQNLTGITSPRPEPSALRAGDEILRIVVRACAVVPGLPPFDTKAFDRPAAGESEAAWLKRLTERAEKWHAACEVRVAACTVLRLACIAAISVVNGEP